MEIIISYAFAHIIEAIILWMSMSQMYEHRYKQWVTGFVICDVCRVSDGEYIFCNGGQSAYIYIIDLYSL